MRIGTRTLRQCTDGVLELQAQYAKLGARPPAGVLLAGPPGTGKTLIARAIAGEAQVPFFNISGTDFNNSFTGVGARKVRDMFSKARKAAPCILFIDEFDGIGMSRAGRDSGGADLTEQQVQTINQLLTEMDGFDDNEGARRSPIGAVSNLVVHNADPAAMHDLAPPEPVMATCSPGALASLPEACCAAPRGRRLCTV